VKTESIGRPECLGRCEMAAIRADLIREALLESNPPTIDHRFLPSAVIGINESVARSWGF
jgi:hypothetical protein